MIDDYNNNTDPEENRPESINDNAEDANNVGTDPEAPVNETPAEEAKEEIPHTTIPGGTQNQDFYSSYQSPDGQYRIVYNRPQNPDPESDRQRTGNGYGYQNPQQQYQQQHYQQQQYQQQYQQQQYQQQQYQQQQYQQYRQPYTARPAQPQKKSGGKIVAVIAICAALAIIFSTVCLVFGLIIAKRTQNNNNNNNQPSVTERGDTETQRIPEETKETTAAVTESAPLTDPDAKIKTSASGQQLQMTEAAAMTVDSVVEIRTEQTIQGSFMQQYVVQGGGSGVIITEDGYIATNNHVIEDATQIKVTLRNGKSYMGTLVGADATADLAVVKIDATGLQPATFGDSSKLVVAETVFAIGNPLGELGGTVTQGIISALERTITIERKAMTLLQTTAAINPGNSGGGLFNLAGECIGIVNAKSSGSGIEGLAFAIPSNTAIKVIQDIMQYGYVRGRVALGVTMVDVSDQYTLYRYNLKEYGVYVSRVTSGSDAEKAGIQSVDRIVSINGTKMETSSQVTNFIQKCSVGDVIEVVISRDGTQMTFSVTLTEYVPDNNPAV